MANVTTLINDKLPMQLDSVSWNQKYDILAIGAYMIDPSDSSRRVGKIFLLQLQLKDEESSSSYTSSYKLEQEVDLSGVLDLKWEPEHQKHLAVATSSSIDLYDLYLDEGQCSLRLLSSLQLTAMALFTQWMAPDRLVYSDSIGEVHIVSVSSSSALELTKSCKIHDNLTWVVQYSPKLDLMFAGSDEGKFTGFLVDNIEDTEKHFTKKFEVGVTSITFIADNILGVGSYDDTLRVFTIDCSDPITLSLKKKIEFGGAVWRTMSFPAPPADAEDTCGIHIVASCARNGVHVICLDSSSWAYETVASCMEHEGFLAYGLDVKVHQNKDMRSLVIASCYFDNQYFHLWKLKVSPD